MKKRIYYSTMMLLIFCLCSCGKKEEENITIPDTVVEETPTIVENINTETIEIEEEIVEEPIEEIPTYPYWWDLHDYNEDQPVLAQDNEIKNLSIQPGNQPNELHITWFSKSSTKGKVVYRPIHNTHRIVLCGRPYTN